MPTCRNCGGGYFEGITGGMMVGPICRCGNRSTSAAPHRAQAVPKGMYLKPSNPQQRLQGQPLSTTTDTVPLGLGIAIGLVLGVVLCLGFVFIF